MVYFIWRVYLFDLYSTACDLDSETGIENIETLQNLKKKLIINAYNSI